MIIRADTSPKMGAGHVMRCLALAQAWQIHGGSVVFAMHSVAPKINARLKGEHANVHIIRAKPNSRDDSTELIDLAHQYQTAWIVVDGYMFDHLYQQAIKDAGYRLLWIDDYGHANHYCADIILNQIPGGDETQYRHRSSSSELMIGTRYALLRREFVERACEDRTFSGDGSRLLVALGGSDPDNMTLKILQSLHLPEHASLEIVVLVGAANPHLSELESWVQQSSLKIHLKHHVSDMPTWIAWADIAIAAAGNTSWEMAFMGLPLITMILADNQRAPAEALHHAGSAINLGWHEAITADTVRRSLNHLLTSPATLEQMSKSGRLLIDGLGPNRVFQRMIQKLLNLRLCQQEDCQRLWQWANDPVTRAASFNPSAIDWQEHVQWFEKMLASKRHRLYIITCQDRPIGQVRFDLDDPRAVISVGLAPTEQGKGLGSHAIGMATRKLFSQSPICSIYAYIRPENIASIHAFEKAQFAKTGGSNINGQSALCFALSR